jgi:hypothetical protein
MKFHDHVCLLSLLHILDKIEICLCHIIIVLIIMRFLAMASAPPTRPIDQKRQPTSIGLKEYTGLVPTESTMSINAQRVHELTAKAA